MGDREKLHDLRQQAHDAGIEGNSKMTEEQLRDALRNVGKGEQPRWPSHTRPSGNERGRHRHLSRVGTAQAGVRVRGRLGVAVEVVDRGPPASPGPG
ncbi:hypothetical protein ACQSSU_23445 [Micromonospora echinospora]